MSLSSIVITECPRDAMQGLSYFVPTPVKINYINLLLQTGFDIIDFGSFVSPKAIPQMADTAEVLDHLDLTNTCTKLLAIVANLRGAEQAVNYDRIDYLGYPFSISETFQQRNTNTSCAAAFDSVQRIQDLCLSHQKHLIIYLSMGFGNPYSDDWNAAIVSQWCSRLAALGISIIQLSDTTGIATPSQINELYPALAKEFPRVDIGLHLHSTPDSLLPKLQAAYASGCRRFDSALRGFGGCPMAKDELTGNVATERLISFLTEMKEPLTVDMNRLNDAIAYSSNVFR